MPVRSEGRGALRVEIRKVILSSVGTGRRHRGLDLADAEPDRRNRAGFAGGWLV